MTGYDLTNKHTIAAMFLINQVINYEYLIPIVLSANNNAGPANSTGDD
jgi:hypothetical protein